MSQIYIYGLIDPRDGQIKYIGQTVNLKKRLVHHSAMVSPAQCPPIKRAWLLDLKANALKPEIFCLEIVDSSEKLKAERFWIGYFRMLGAKLTNYKVYGPPRKSIQKPYKYFRSNRQPKLEGQAAS